MTFYRSISVGAVNRGANSGQTVQNFSGRMAVTILADLNKSESGTAGG